MIFGTNIKSFFLDIFEVLIFKKSDLVFSRRAKQKAFNFLCTRDRDRDITSIVRHKVLGHETLTRCIENVACFSRPLKYVLSKVVVFCLRHQRLRVSHLKSATLDRIAYTQMISA